MAVVGAVAVGVGLAVIAALADAATDTPMDGADEVDGELIALDDEVELGVAAPGEAVPVGLALALP